MAALAVGLLSSVAQAVDITTRGQMVPANQVGTLVANLDCSGAPSGSAAVSLIAPRGGILIDSLLSANTLNGVLTDIVTGRRPILINASCNVSVRLIDDSPSGTWGVCSGD